MKKTHRILIGLLALTMALVSNYPAAYSLPNKDDGNEGEEVLAIEVSIPGRKPLTVPVTNQQKSAIVPLAGAQATAVQVIPRLDGSEIAFEVRAILDPLPQPLSCDKLKQLRSESIDLYTAVAGKTVRISALDKFGVSPFDVKVMKVKAAQVCPGLCCCCHPLTCCPNKDSCIQCGDCGLCCLS